MLCPFFAKDALPYVRRAISFAGRALVCQATILSQEVGADGLCQDHLLLYYIYIYNIIYIIHGLYVYIYSDPYSKLVNTPRVFMTCVGSLPLLSECLVIASNIICCRSVGPVGPNPMDLRP